MTEDNTNQPTHETLHLLRDQRMIVAQGLRRHSRRADKFARRAELRGQESDHHLDSAIQADSLAQRILEGADTFDADDLDYIRMAVIAGRFGEDGSDDLYGEPVDLNSLVDQLNRSAILHRPIANAPKRYPLHLTADERATLGVIMGDAFWPGSEVVSPHKALEARQGLHTGKRLRAGDDAFTTRQIELMLLGLESAQEFDPPLTDPQLEHARTARVSVHDAYNHTDRTVQFTTDERQLLVAVLENYRDAHLDPDSNPEHYAAPLTRDRALDLDQIMAAVDRGDTTFRLDDLQLMDEAFSPYGDLVAPVGLVAARTRIHEAAMVPRATPLVRDSASLADLSRDRVPLNVSPERRALLVGILRDHRAAALEDPPASTDDVSRMFGLLGRVDELAAVVDNGAQWIHRGDLDDIHDALDRVTDDSPQMRGLRQQLLALEPSDTLDLTHEQRQLLHRRLIESGNLSREVGQYVKGIGAGDSGPHFEAARDATVLAKELDGGGRWFAPSQIAMIRSAVAAARTAEDGSGELYGQPVDLDPLAEQLNTLGDDGPTIPPAPATYLVEFTNEQRQATRVALGNSVFHASAVFDPAEAREADRRRRTVRRLGDGVESFSSVELELMLDALDHPNEDPLLLQPAQRRVQEAKATVRRAYDDTDRPLYLTASERAQLVTVLSNAREDRYQRADDEEQGQALYGSVDRAAALRRAAPVFDALAGDVRTGRAEFDRVEFDWMDQALAGQQWRTGLDGVRTQVHAGAAEHRSFPWEGHADDTPETEMPDFFTVYPYERVPLVQALKDYQRSLTTEAGSGDNTVALADHFAALTTQVDQGQNGFTKQDLDDIFHATAERGEALPVALQPLMQRLATARPARSRQSQEPDPMKAAFTPLTHGGAQQHHDSAARPAGPPTGASVTRSHPRALKG